MRTWSVRSRRPRHTGPSDDDGIDTGRAICLMRYDAICIVPGTLAIMTKAVTVRLDDADHAALEKQARELRVRPGTLARMLLHAGLTGSGPAAGSDAPRAALDRLVARSQRQAAGDAVALVADARVALDPQR